MSREHPVACQSLLQFLQQRCDVIFDQRIESAHDKARWECRISQFFIRQNAKPHTNINGKMTQSEAPVFIKLSARILRASEHVQISLFPFFLVRVVITLHHTKHHVLHTLSSNDVLSIQKTWNRESVFESCVQVGQLYVTMNES